jgi:GNAT superfamily N-acetyltransferase
LKLALEADADGEVLKTLMAGMKTFNNAAVQSLNSHKIVATVRDDEAHVVGGVIGGLAGDSMYLEVVWTASSARGKGFGRKLMQMAETEAKRLGAREVWLYTMSFQAKPFYEKLGYHQFAELKWLDGARHFMRKDL